MPADKTRYLSTTKREFLKYYNARPDMDMPLGIRIMPGAAVSAHKPNVKLFPQKIKNVKIWRRAPKNAEYIDQDVIFLGYADSFFGHFLADSMSRAWPILDEKYKDYAFAVVVDKPLAPFARELYKLAGFKKLFVIKQSTAFRNLLVPDSSFGYTKMICNRKYTDTFAKIANAVKSNKTSPKKIYFSRTKLPHNPTVGEARIEKAFRDKGFTVVHMETLAKPMPMRRQIALVKNATDIAGLSGTALHQSLFMQDGVRLVCLNRYNAPIPMQILIDKLKNIDAHYIDASTDPYSKRKNTCPACLVGINDNVRRFFDDNKFICQKCTRCDKEEMKRFLKIYAANHRILPKWLIRLILIFVPSQELRRNLRKKFAEKF